MRSPASRLAKEFLTQRFGVVVELSLKLIQLGAIVEGGHAFAPASSGFRAICCASALALPSQLTFLQCLGDGLRGAVGGLFIGPGVDWTDSIVVQACRLKRLNVRKAINDPATYLQISGSPLLPAPLFERARRHEPTTP
jgi:hypothetical protein